MITAATPDDEVARIAALVDYKVLDSLPEPNFDELTELISRVLDVPIALVSLIDSNRQWFKSHFGLDVTETPREHAFCSHAILNDQVMIVEDSHLDERFIDNPLVTGDPNVRFYAGMPLITKDGYKIGTVCGIDHEPRVLDENQKRVLEIVSGQVIDQLELRKSVHLKELLFRKQNALVKRLEGVNQEVRDFVSVVTHDLRAPVLNAGGFAEELLEAADSLDAKISSLDLGIPENQKNSIADLVNDDIRLPAVHIVNSIELMEERITAISQVGMDGGRELHLELVDLHCLVSEISREHDSVLKKIGGEILVGPLPSIRVDKMSVQLIIENVISNAVKYHKVGTPLRVTVDSNAEAEGFDINVADNGQGIAPSNLSRIFAMYKRVGDQKAQGDGVGLAHTRAIVNRIGGQIWCDSVVGEGSTFHIYLPSEAIYLDGSFSTHQV